MQNGVEDEIGVEYVDGDGDEEYYEDGDGDYEDDQEGDDDEMEGDVEEIGEEDEVAELPNAQYIQGLGQLQGQGQQASGSAGGKGWEGLSKMTAATQKFYHTLLEQLRGQGKDSLTLLVIGKEGVGKTALVNALVNENTSPPEGFGQRRLPRPRLTARKAAGFTLNVIDCPGLSEGDAGCDVILSGMAESLQGRDVDAVLLVDRLDFYRVEELDKQVWASITRALGSSVWQHTIIALSHGRMNTLPPETSYGEYVERRAGSVRSAVRKAGRCGKAALPLAVVESSSKCNVDGDGVKTLPDGTRWVASLLEQVADMAGRGPWRPKVLRGDNPDKRHRLLIPLVLAAQVAFKILVLDPMLDRDREEWSTVGNPCINLEADAKKRAEWEKRDAAPKKTRRVHEGARLARQ